MNEQNASDKSHKEGLKDQGDILAKTSPCSPYRKDRETAKSRMYNTTMSVTHIKQGVLSLIDNTLRPNLARRDKPGHLVCAPRMNLLQ